MEFNNILYIIGAIIYLIYTGNKELKKHRQNRPGQDSGEEAKSWQKEVEEMMKQVMKNEPEQPEAQTVEVPKPKVKQAPVHRHEDDFLATEREEYLRRKKAEEILHAKSEAYSVETDDTPLSEHITIPEMKRKEEEPSIGAALIHEEGFDARKAFVYSEIFNRRGGRR